MFMMKEYDVCEYIHICTHTHTHTHTHVHTYTHTIHTHTHTHTHTHISHVTLECTPTELVLAYQPNMF